MIIKAFEEVPIGTLPALQREMMNKITRLTLFPNLNDLVIKHRFSDHAYYPCKSDGLFMATKLPALSHEISHMVEAPIDRITKPDWGISLDYNIIQWGSRKLFAALAREIRVRTIEQWLELEISPPDRLHTRIFSNYIWSGELRKRLPFGEFRTYEDVVEWGNDIHKDTVRNWSFGRILTEWNKRTDILNNWMETKPSSSDQMVYYA